jgi:peroxiredoxin Q/BCP
VSYSRARRPPRLHGLGDSLACAAPLVTPPPAAPPRYPRANTGGCTKQALGFKAHAAELGAAGFEIFGLSHDSPKSQSSWRAKHDLPYRLLTDAKDGAALRAFGAAKPDKKISRSHAVVAKGGALLHVRNAVSPGDSFAEAARFVAALEK